MGIKTYNPYTPSRRNMTGSDFSEITKTTPEKSLTTCLLYTSPSPRDPKTSRMPSSA